MAMTNVPNPALRRLDRLVGTWKLTGRTTDAQEDDISGWTTFEWMLGGLFLKAIGEIDFKGLKVESMEIIGYDPASGTFHSNVYSTMSEAGYPYHWDVQGNTVTHWMDTSKYTGRFSEDGNILSGGWRPIEGKVGAEDVVYDAVMTRMK
jgi:hypothetical protein